MGDVIQFQSFQDPDFVKWLKKAGALNIPITPLDPSIAGGLWAEMGRKELGRKGLQEYR